jgi:hypothetical protein
MTDQLAFCVRQESFTAGAAYQSLDVVGAESLQESHAVCAGDADLRAVADIDKTGVIQQERVLFDGFRSDGRGRHVQSPAVRRT